MEKKKEFIVNAIFFALIFTLVYLGINYVLPIVFPFIMGFIFAYFARILSKKFLKKETKPYLAVTLILMYILILILGIVLVSFGIGKVVDFVSAIPSFYNSTVSPYIMESLDVIQHNLNNLNDMLPENIAGSLSTGLDSLFSALNSGIAGLASNIVGATTGIITSTPNVIISVILTLVSSFYILLDYQNITRWVDDSLPANALAVLGDIKEFCENVLFKILGSYAVIMFFTCAELMLGFTLIGIPNAILWAMVISVVDILPVLGVGTVLIPWGVIAMVVGDVLLGAEILLLYIIITIIRNIIEPKLVGVNLGLHPLATLISMIVGANIFGVLGMFGFPLTLSFIYNRFKNS
ncbi:MAG: sporulation integral membrane protein YtvI [Erysipelotrichaceae bacterium]|nr:sporulation integral membrane protein YtvI [Erysipelotrichaceae bacterium]